MVTYKINLTKLKQNYIEFNEFGPVYFPVKTNHNSIILKELKKLGCGFETDSIEHIKKVYSPKIANKIMYSNVAKSYSDMLWAVKHKIVYYTIDDEETLKQIINLAVKYNLSNLKFNVRLNVYECFKLDFDKKGARNPRLGSFVETVKKLLQIINSENRIKIEKGLSFYIQAEIHNDEDCLIKMLNFIINKFNKAEGISFINIGGGSNKERLNYSMLTIEKALAHFGANYIVLEPGRYLVGNVEDVDISCIRVVDNLKTQNEIVASLYMGIYNGLIDKQLHNRQFEIYATNGKNTVKLEQAKDNEQNLVLRGPTADSLDIIGIYALPSIKIDNNTTFIIKNIGAYVEVFDSAFSGKINTNCVEVN